MLKELSIQNLAVIASAVIPLEAGFNAFTGETGAGKSILIHGIQAVLGQRVSRDMVRAGEKKAIISGVFSPIPDSAAAILAESAEAYGYPLDADTLMLTREISADGGSIGRINGKTVPVTLLRQVGETLVNIHGQHDNQILLRPDRHLDVLDQFGEDNSLRLRYQEEFQALQTVARKLGQAKKAEQQKQQRILALQEIMTEIAELDPQPDEDTLLDEQYQQAAKAEQHSAQVTQITQVLTDGEENLSDALAVACEWLNRLADSLPDAAPLAERLRSLNIELRDISDSLSDCAGNPLSPAEFARLNDRRNAVNTLTLRYQTDANGLRNLLEQSMDEMEQLQSDADSLAELAEERQRRLHVVTDLAKQLSAYRKQLAQAFSERVAAELAELNMPKVRLCVQLTQGKLTPSGMDNAEFYISTNPGDPPKPIAQIASGGELSRLMLALKAVIAKRDDIPTLIFDEIDTGVSGNAAQKIGRKLRQLSTHHQVLCVTHLAQLATQANHHLLIEKQSDLISTNTQVSVLTPEQRVHEIARIMSGDQPSELLLQTAREALEQAQQKKLEKLQNTP